MAGGFFSRLLKKKYLLKKGWRMRSQGSSCSREMG